MKLPAIVSAILALTAIILLFFMDFGDPDKGTPFNLEQLESASEAQQEQILVEAFLPPALPKGQEAELLAWIFRENSGQGISLIRDQALVLENLPLHLGKAVILLAESGQPDASLRAMALARRLFPNDPDTLAAAGILAFLAGDTQAARDLLQRALTWKKEMPQADFYLGGILLESESAADRSRGKSLLLDIAESRHKEFAVPASLMLLTSATVPVLEGERETLLDILQEEEALTADNERLTPAVLRSLANQAARPRPELAVRLAGMLLETEEATLSDTIGLIQLQQDLGKYAEAGDLLEPLAEEDPQDMEPALRQRLARLLAFNDLATGRYPEALERFEVLVETQGDQPPLHETFRRALDLELPISFQRSFFPLYLEMPILSPLLSLFVLERLMELDPLQEERWLSYAVDRILPGNPALAAQWLTGHESHEEIVQGLESLETPLTREQYMALIEAHLALGQAAGARESLNQARDLLKPVHLEYYQARIHLLEEDRDSAQEYWTAAHNAALGDNAYEMLKALGFLAIELDQPVNALQSLYTAFTAGIPFTAPEASRLITLTLSYGSLNESMKVAEYLHKTYPGEPVYVNNLAYFKFLAGEELDTHVDNMRELVEEYADVAQYRLTLALGLLKVGRNNEAMRLLQSKTINWNETSTRGQLIYAAVLSANDQQLAAEGFIQNIDLEELILEEKALIEAL